MIQKAREQYYEAPLIEDEKKSIKFWKTIKQVFLIKNTKINSSTIANLLKNKAKLIKDFDWGSPVEMTSRTDKEFNFECIPNIFIERELIVIGTDDLNAG